MVHKNKNFKKYKNKFNCINNECVELEYKFAKIC